MFEYMNYASMIYSNTLDMASVAGKIWSLMKKLESELCLKFLLTAHKDKLQLIFLFSLLL
jgi:hypothetical protein